jgi:hypothetical protein
MAGLGDATAQALFARAHLARHEPHVGAHFLRAPEARDVIFGALKRERGDRPNARRGTQPVRDGVRAYDLRQRLVDRGELLGQSRNRC